MPRRGVPPALPPGGGEEGSIPAGLLAAAERVRGGASGPSGKKGRRGKGYKKGRGKGRRPAGSSGGLRLLTGILGAIAVGLVLLIAAGTLYALLRDPESFPGASSRAGVSASTEGAGTGAPATGTPGTGMFTGIGRLRIAAPSGAAVVLSIVFPYPPADRPFTEELAASVPRFRQIARDYFGSLSRDELDSLDEQRAKAEILRSFNNELRLGQIELLLFNDLLILE